MPITDDLGLLKPSAGIKDDLGLLDEKPRKQYEYDPYEALGQGVPDMTKVKGGDVPTALLEVPGIILKKGAQTIQRGGPGAGGALMQFTGEFSNQNDRELLKRPMPKANVDYTGTIGMEEPLPAEPLREGEITKFMRIGGQAAREYWEKAAKDEVLKTKVNSFTDIGSVADGIRFGAGAFGNLAGSMALVAGTGGLGSGGVRGAAGIVATKEGVKRSLGGKVAGFLTPKPLHVPIAYMEGGEIAGGQLEAHEKEGKDLSPLRLTATTMLATILEGGVGTEAMASKFLSMGPEVKDFAKKTLVKRILQGGTISGFEEGGQEALQTVVEKLGGDPSKVWTKETLTEMIDSALQGMAGGHVMGTIGGAGARKQYNDTLAQGQIERDILAAPVDYNHPQAQQMIADRANVARGLEEYIAETDQQLATAFGQHASEAIRNNQPVDLSMLTASGLFELEDLTQKEATTGAAETTDTPAETAKAASQGAQRADMDVYTPFLNSLRESYNSGEMTKEQLEGPIRQGLIDKVGTDHPVIQALDDYIATLNLPPGVGDGMNMIDKGLEAIGLTTDPIYDMMVGKAGKTGGETGGRVVRGLSELDRAEMDLEKFPKSEPLGPAGIRRTPGMPRPRTGPMLGGEVVLGSGDGITEIGQSVSNSILADAQLFGNSSDAESLRSKGFQSIDRDRQHMLLSKVGAALNNDEVFRAVVETVPIDVMNNLIGEKLSTDDLLHNKSMLTHRFAVPRDIPIAESVVRFMDSLATKVSGISTGFTTKESDLSGMNATSGKGNPAILTNVGPHIVTSSVGNQPIQVNITPTEGQKQAGNYLKGSINLHGLNISIENPKGSTRSGVSPDGKPWQSELKAHYGYLRRTEGHDGDAVDVFIGPNPSSQKVFVVYQNDPVTGKFDEHKALIGWDDIQSAKAGYLANYEPGWKGLGTVVPMSMDSFKTWLKKTTPVTKGKERAAETQAQRPEGPQVGDFYEFDVPTHPRGPTTFRFQVTHLFVLDNGRIVPLVADTKSDPGRTYPMLASEMARGRFVPVREGLETGAFPMGQAKPAEGTPIPAPTEAAKKAKQPKTLIQTIMGMGGISAEKVKAAGYNIKEDFQQHGLSFVFRKGGMGLDDLVTNLVSAGVITEPPAHVDGGDYLLDLMQKAAKKQKVTIDEIQNSDDALVKEQKDDILQLKEDLRRHGADESQIEDAVRAYQSTTREDTGIEETQEDAAATRDSAAGTDEEFVSEVEEPPAPPTGGELFNTDDMFTLSGNQPFTQGTMKVPDKRGGDRLLDVEKQTQDELRDRLSGEKAKREYEEEQGTSSKELWQMTAIEATSERARGVFPLDGKVEIENGKPVYKYSTTVKWEDGEKTFEAKTKGPLNGAQQAERLHKEIVKQALSEGKPVSEEVLKDYPELIKPAPKALEENKTEPEPEKAAWYINADNRPVFTVPSDAMGYRGPYTKREVSDLTGTHYDDLGKAKRGEPVYTAEYPKERFEKTPEPEAGWREHLIKARRYALDLGITKDQVKDWNSADSIAEAIDKKLATNTYGADNKVFTKDRADKAREILRKKLNQMNAGIDPEMLAAGIDVAGYYIEGGARKFADFSTKMVEDLTEAIRPYLKSFYLAVRNYPGFDNAGMQTEAELDKEEEILEIPQRPEGAFIGVYENEASFRQDLKKFTKELKALLGYEPETGKKGKDESVSINIAPAGGDGTIILWKPDSDYGVYVSVPVQRRYGTDVLELKGTLGQGLIMWRVTTKDDKWGGKSNQWASSDIIPAALADRIKAEVYRYDKTEAEPEPVTKSAKAAASSKIADWVVSRLDKGQSFTKEELFEQSAEAFGGTMAEGIFNGKDAFDALEMGINRWIMKQKYRVAAYEDAKYDISHAQNNVDYIRKYVLDKIPSQTGLRSEEQDEFQQFSTPPDLAYVMAWVAKLTKKDTVLEPSAGIGGIAMYAKNTGSTTIVNELSKRRAEILKEMGFDEVYGENAEQIYNILHGQITPSVVLMNPPFSSTAGRVKGQRKSGNVVQHLDQALKLLQPGGRLVALIGKGWYDDPKAVSDYFQKLRTEYNLRAIITIDGKGYAKYGTTYDNRILVIDKTDPENRPTIEKSVDNVRDAIPILKEVRDARRNVTPQQTSAQSEGQGVLTGSQGNGVPGQPVRPATGEVGDRKGGSGGTVSDRGNAEHTDAGKAGADNAGADTGAATRPGGNFKPGEWPEGSRRPSVGGTRSTGERSEPGVGADETTDQGLKVEAKAAEKATGELSDSVYESYTPQKVKIEGAKAHPGKLVESAAMSIVEPPAPTYSPKLAVPLIKEGRFSLAQLEAITYAGQAHSQMLPQTVIDDNGHATDIHYRKGYFIGDGTGVGKGREIAGIIRDNFNQGRKKAIWISQNSPLLTDAKRDLQLSGWNADLIFDLGKQKPGKPVSVKEGIAFLGYDLLKWKDNKNKNISRVNQLIEWFGKDFDGVIVFDESHNLGNAIGVKGVRGTSTPSSKALAGVELQRRLPNARVVYVSATGATEVTNLSYVDRLGLWGEGTSFASKQDFVTQIASGGIAAMEFVARDLKAMGSYLARSLSYEDVKYNRLEHKLTPEQREVYDELASAWQMVLGRINEALNTTGGNHNGNARGAALSAFWGSLQRFFNQIITSMQTPEVINAMEEDLKKGSAVVIQLVNTNEAAQNRAIAKMEEGDDLEDLDLTPRDQFMQYVRNSFPVAQYEEVTDPSDPTKTIWVAVLDSNGTPVENPEAVAMREALLNKLGSIRVPDGPLEMLLNHFGHEKVAEVTGRSRRVVTVDDEQGRHKIIEKRSKAKAMADADAFMADKKPILVFSDAGGTGRSYHADLNAKNQKLRRHYLLQAGWRADKAIQGFGRTHRTNQAQAPEYILVTTDIIGQKRFMSSIARRLDQLGALTKGQRETGSGGFFTARDNLESTYAQDAISRLIQDIYGHSVPDWDIGEFIKQTGLTRLVNPKDGSLNVDAIPPVTQFLNRLLAMNLDKQVEVFDLFSLRLDQNIRAAMAAGTLDVGLETMRAKKVEKAGEQVVHTDEQTGAQTKYVRLNVTRDAPIYRFNEVRDSWKAGGFFVNTTSGQVWAASASRTETDANTGALKTHINLHSPRGTSQSVLPQDLDNKEKYRKLSDREARDLWDSEYEASPKEVTYQEHFITGALLPVWDRLQGKARIMRVQTSEGERLIGRLLDPKRLTDTLKALGATTEQATHTPNELFSMIRDQGFTVELANGWKIKRAKIAGEQRIELVGPDYRHEAELSRNGIFQERVNWQTRFFIPTNATGGETVRAIVKNRPVVNTIAPLNTREDLGHNAPSFRKAEGKTAGKYTAANLAKLLNPITSKVQDRTGVKVIVVQDNKGFPADFIERAGSDFDPNTTKVYAAYDPKTNTIYLVADSLDSTSFAEKVLFEELVGHKGIRAFLGKEKMNQLRKMVYQQFKDDPAMKKVIRDYELDVRNEDDRLMAGDEFIAHNIDRPTLLDKIVAFLRDAMRSMGFKVRMSDADMRTLVGDILNKTESVMMKESPANSFNIDKEEEPRDNNDTEGTNAIDNIEGRNPLSDRRYQSELARVRETLSSASNGEIKSEDITAPAGLTEDHRRVIDHVKEYGFTPILFEGTGTARFVCGFSPSDRNTIYINTNSPDILAVANHELMHKMQRMNPELIDNLIEEIQADIEDAMGLSIFNVNRDRRRVGLPVLEENEIVGEYLANLAEGTRSKAYENVKNAEKVYTAVNKAMEDFRASIEEHTPAMKEAVLYEGQPLYKKGSQFNDAFRKWFGKSKVVDEKGEPLVVYHGTNEDFDIFDTSATRQFGGHFTPSADMANEFTGAEGGRVIPAYLSLQNPLDLVSDLGDWTDMDMLEEYLTEGNDGPFTNKEFAKFKTPDDVKEALIKKGYDGIKYQNSFEGDTDTGMSSEEQDVYIAFSPSQIKSVYNRGTWDQGDARISFKKEAAADPLMDLLNKANPDLAKKLQDILDDVQKQNKSKESLGEPTAFDNIPDPQTTGVKETENWLNRETGAIFRTIAAGLPGNTAHNSFLENVLKSPEWYEHPVMKNIVRLFTMDRERLYHTTLMDLTTIDDQSVIDETDNLRKTNPEAYKELLFAIDYGDTKWKRGEDSMKRLRDPDISEEARKAVVENQVKKYEEYLRDKRGVSEEAIRVWKLHRASYDKALDMMTAQLRDLIEKMDEKGITEQTRTTLQELRFALASMNEWRGFYAPRLRERAGYAVQADRPSGKETEHYRGHANQYGAQRLANKLKAEGWKNVRITEISKLPESVYQNLKAVDVAKAIKAASEGLTGDAAIALNDELIENVSNLIKSRGYRSSMIHRGAPEDMGVVLGYMDDPLERYTTYVNNLAGGFSKSIVAQAAMQQLLGQRNEEGKLVGGIDAKTESRTYETAERYLAEQLRNLDRTDRMIGVAKSIATFKYLGFNPRSMLVNMTAMVTTVPPALHQYVMGGKGSINKVMAEITKAGADISAVMVGKKKLKDTDEQAFIERIQREGYDDPQLTRDMMGKTAAIHKRLWSKAMGAAMWMFGKTEQFNRMSTMLAGYRLARKMGKTDEEAYTLALDGSNKAHGLYGRGTLPAWAQGGNPAAKGGQLVYVYGKFGHNYLQMMYDLGFKKHDIKAFTWGFIAPLVVAGGAAWPLKDLMFGIIDAILRLLGYRKGAEKYVYDAIRQHLGKTAEIGARHGLTGLAGIDISGSLSIGVGVPKSMWELTGAAGGVYEDAAKAWRYIQTNQPERALEKAIPTAFANPIRAFRESTRGVTTEKGRRIFGEDGRPLKLSGGNIALRTMGFRPSDQAVASERKREHDAIVARFNDRRDEIYEEARAYFSNPDRDSTGMTRLMQRVAEYNEDLRDNDLAGLVPKMKYSGLKDQAKSMRKADRSERRRLSRER